MLFFIHVFCNYLVICSYSVVSKHLIEKVTIFSTGFGISSFIYRNLLKFRILFLIIKLTFTYHTWHEFVHLRPLSQKLIW